MLRLRFIAGGRVFAAMGRYLAEEAALNKVHLSPVTLHSCLRALFTALSCMQSQSAHDAAHIAVGVAIPCMH